MKLRHIERSSLRVSNDGMTGTGSILLANIIAMCKGLLENGRPILKMKLMLKKLWSTKIRDVKRDL